MPVKLLYGVSVASIKKNTTVLCLLMRMSISYINKYKRVYTFICYGLLFIFITEYYIYIYIYMHIYTYIYMCVCDTLENSGFQVIQVNVVF